VGNEGHFLRTSERLQYFKGLNSQQLGESGGKGRVRDYVSPSFHGRGGRGKEVSRRPVFHAINESAKDKYNNCDLDRQSVVSYSFSLHFRASKIRKHLEMSRRKKTQHVEGFRRIFFFRSLVPENSERQIRDCCRSHNLTYKHFSIT